VRDGAGSGWPDRRVSAIAGNKFQAAAGEGGASEGGGAIVEVGGAQNFMAIVESDRACRGGGERSGERDGASEYEGGEGR